MNRIVKSVSAKDNQFITEDEVAIVTQNADYKGEMLSENVLKISKGWHVASIKIYNIDDNDLLVDGECLAIVSVRNNDANIAQTMVFPNHICSGASTINLPFKVEEDADIGIHIFSLGVCSLAIDKIIEFVSSSEFLCRYYPALSINEGDDLPDIAIKGVDRIRAHYEHGGTARLYNKKLILSYQDISFYINNMEDFDTAFEIFNIKNYVFANQNKFICIDVGLNIGLASLCLARMPYVLEVHSYDPFPLPIMMAKENMLLNPELSKKIHIYPCGIGANDRTEVVLIESNTTIGTSVRGHGTGVEQEIKIRDAARVFQGHLNEAREKGCHLAVKIDCEGSEYEILNRLEETGLLSEIRLIMLEIHKGWLPNTGAVSVEKQLIRCGFLILNKSLPQNINSGMMYAVRI